MRNHKMNMIIRKEKMKMNRNKDMMNMMNRNMLKSIGNVFIIDKRIISDMTVKYMRKN